MEKLKLLVPVTHYPRSMPATLPAGTEVILIRRESAILFSVTLTDESAAFPVLASEVQEPQPA